MYLILIALFLLSCASINNGPVNLAREMWWGWKHMRSGE